MRGYRTDGNYGNLDGLFATIKENGFEGELIKEEFGTFIRTKHINSNYGASIIEEHTNGHSPLIRFEVGFI